MNWTVNVLTSNIRVGTTMVFSEPLVPGRPPSRVSAGDTLTCLFPDNSRSAGNVLRAELEDADISVNNHGDWRIERSNETPSEAGVRTELPSQVWLVIERL